MIVQMDAIAEEDFLDEDDDEYYKEERKEELENTILQMPNIGFSQFTLPIMKMNNSCNKWNRRLLVVNNEYIGYISKVPKNNEITEKDVPKLCCHVSYILSVGSVSDAEVKKYKKRITDPDTCFKVEMIK